MSQIRTIMRWYWVVALVVAALWASAVRATGVVFVVHSVTSHVAGSKPACVLYDHPLHPGPLDWMQDPEPVAPNEAPPSIDAWFTRWSEFQARWVWERCERPECDPSQWEPEARPGTGFGWDGAEKVERVQDWAAGPRYIARAKGQEVVMYLMDGDVVAVYTLTEEGGLWREICRGDACNPSW